MSSPSYEERICAMFDSYVKKVLRNCARNLKRNENNQNKHLVDEPVEYFLELASHRDKYPSDAFVLYVDGHACEMEDETLYKALLSLSERQRRVLLLDFWCDRTVKEIAEEMGVTPRTVNNIKRGAFRAIIKFYE